MSNNRFSRLFAIAKQKSIDKEQIESIVKDRFHKKSLTELTDNELGMLEKWVKQEEKGGPQKMRRKVIYLLASMGEYVTQDGRTYKFVKDKKPNMYGIYEFIKHVGYLKKDLNLYTTDELIKLVNQVERFRKNTYEQEANKAVKDLLA